ncbi:MAG TPA: hypothetical protein VFS25_08040 [Chitinophaga sp.]|jgi:hypothetical protein|uniref:hypothetical protein n=1 Tax=Chitinophaga sp. TaxID=1869181 RepID=UPI002DBA6ABB|nr:hypothetical protein [Chitinophaga sp.]HEU4552769.1 hypothetical protein [Chitinophaga sp.]
MLTFVTILLLRLYYPRWKREWRFYAERSRQNKYGRWAMDKAWSSDAGYSLSYS